MRLGDVERSAINAINSDLRALSPSFIPALRECLASPQQLLPGIDPSGAFPQPRSSFDLLVQSHVSRHLAQGEKGERAVERGLKSAMQSQVEAHLRAIEGHVRMKSPRDVPAMRNRLAAALAPSQIDACCDQVINHGKAAPFVTASKVFDPEEDLL
ncbi:MAG: hypothetical protein HY286_09325 [Planctomycetes bacterium]|nr:hypothetical protein [Planctomycetota bacterium]